MSAPASPADTRAFIIERLTGETGEPERIIEAGTQLAARVMPAIESSLNGLVSFPVSLELGGVDVARMAGALPPAGSNSAVTIASSANSPDALVIAADAAAIFLMVNGLFGADPALAAEVPSRPLSPIEVDVATSLFEVVANAINGPERRSMQVRFPLPPAMTGAEIAKQTMRDGPAVRIAIAMSTAGSQGTIIVTMPQRVLLKPRTPEAPKAREAERDRSEWTQRFGEEIKRSAVTLDAIVPLGSMTLGDLARLRVGQTLELPETAQADTKLVAKDKTLFVCEFGRLGQNYTVRIRHPFDEEQDLMDELLAS